MKWIKNLLKNIKNIANIFNEKLKRTLFQIRFYIHSIQLFLIMLSKSILDAVDEIYLSIYEDDWRYIL